MSILPTKGNPFWFFLLAYLLLFAVTINNGFFWDTTHLASRQAWWYYDNNFKYFFLPTDIDSGHPSFFAMLLALMWKLFGVKIAVGHIMMLPFIVLLIWEAIQLCRYYFKTAFPYIAALLLFNPVVLGQAALVSPDVVLFGFFCFTLNGILENRKMRMLIGSLVLGAISMRGMMCVAFLCLFAALRQGISIRSLVRSTLLFSPGILIVIIFLSLHYLHAGWIGYHANSPWAPSFESTGIKGFARNIVVFLFRMVDMGLVFIWLFLGGAVVYHAKKGKVLSGRTKELLLLWVLCFLISVLLQFFYRFSLLHRYLLPLFTITILISCSLAEERLTLRQFKRVCLLSMLGLLSGNFWVYPDPIAKGWDATLAHLPYYNLRKEALKYIHAEQIPLKDINAGFPYNLTGKCIDLSNDTATYSPLPPEQSPYVLYSNISNDYSDEQLRAFKNDWIPLKKFGGWPVRFVLYKNPSL